MPGQTVAPLAPLPPCAPGKGEAIPGLRVWAQQRWYCRGFMGITAVVLRRAYGPTDEGVWA
eukprot:538406-Rhodomonas_salina.1